MKSKNKRQPVCTICRQPATRTVDGEPSCEQHAQLIYENQLEDYTRNHLADGEWKESPATVTPAKAPGARSATMVKG